MVSNKTKRGKAGVFIDDSNIFWQVLKGKGYPLKLKNVRPFLESRVPFPIKFCRLYGCIGDRNKKGQQAYYNEAKRVGIETIIKSLETIKGKVIGDMDYEIKEGIKKCVYDSDVKCIVLFSGDKHFIPELTDWLNAGKYVEIFSFRGSRSKKIMKLTDKFPKAHYTGLGKLNIKKVLEFRKNLTRVLDRVKI